VYKIVGHRGGDTGEERAVVRGKPLNQGDWHIAKTLKPGQRAPRSGVYKIVGHRGGDTGEERTVVRGKPLPPILHTKSGRIIITSPAKSANTRISWSRAFKK
jgi:hypothetical protein